MERIGVQARKTGGERNGSENDFPPAARSFGICHECPIYYQSTPFNEHKLGTVVNKSIFCAIFASGFGTMVPLFLGCTWLAIEIIFWIVFHAVLVPKANQRRTAAPYRAPYKTERHLLLRRILHRVYHDAQTSEPAELRAVVASFLLSWFRAEEDQPVAKKISSSNSSIELKQTYSSFTLPKAFRLTNELSTTLSSSSESEASMSSSTGSADESTSFTKETFWTIPNLYKPEMDDLLAWALFGKEMVDMNDAELAELSRCYEEFFDLVQLSFKESHNSFGNEGNHCGGVPKLVPRRSSLEDVQPWHRPLAVYVLIYILNQYVMSLILECMGFQRVVSKSTGLRGWFRPSRNHAERMPFIFFHGIAPAGVLLYLPMIWGLLSNGSGQERPCILVDQPNISCTLAFDALTEEQTVRGVHDIVETCCLPEVPLTVCGHSFGSCPITWLLNDDSPLRKRIRQCVLIDPVTLLLSDPAVMTNFLYAQEISSIRMIASSELFTEYYLRRHFSWYNSELWLDEILSTTGNSDGDDDNNKDGGNMHVIVALSELDKIVDAPKIQRHADLWVGRQGSFSGGGAAVTNRLRMVYWKGVGHASCVTDPRKWGDVQAAMLQSELELLPEQK